MKTKSIFLALAIGSVTFINGQIGINTENPKATLDILGKPTDVTSLDGVIAPRISGNDLSLKTYTSAQTGALIYVTSASNTLSGQTVDVTTVGYYYFNGDPTINKWIKINTGSGTVSGWGLTGNSGTVPGTSFLGTSDDKDLIFKRNNIQGGWLSSSSASASAFGNTAFGTGALPFSTVTGTQNTALGGNSGSGITTGSNNIVIGYAAQAASNTASNQLNIGNAIFGTGLSGNLTSPAGYIGIGTSSPNRKLEVNAADTSNNIAPIRITNLATVPANTPTYGLVINPSNGDVYANDVQSVSGQIIRLGINAASYSSTESGLRFNLHSSDALMGTAPNSAPNYINKIIGSSISTGVSVPAGSGAPARITDRILLPIGVYKVTVRLVYSGIGSTFFLKSIVNGSEYSLIRVTGSSSATTTFYEDFINITDVPQNLDFTISSEGFGTLSVIDRLPAGTGQSYRSVILIERLR